MNEIRAKATVLRFLLAWSSATASLVLVICGLGGAVYGQPSEDRVMIQEIRPFASSRVVGRGDETILSVIVIGSDGIEDQSLASTVNFVWSASEGHLEVHGDTTRATYTAPARILGTQTVTVSAGSACVGDATECTATFTLKVWNVYRPPPPSPWQNPPGEIPTALVDAEGNQYAVFTPEEGGTFNGGEFWVSALPGDVPNGEYIGVRMFENGPASNVGMSDHAYTLSGNQYRVSVIDAEGAPISSYSLNGTVTACIPVPDELRTNLADFAMVTKNNDGTITPMSSRLRITSLGRDICGSRSTLPATVAVGIRGTPPPLLEPDPEPAEMLPATGGAVPISQRIMVWALLVGVTLIVTGIVTNAYGRSREGNR